MTDRELIFTMGGIRPVARKLGHRNHTTVQGWADRNRIPEEWRATVTALAVQQDAAA